jgi:hypothetical protein
MSADNLNLVAEQTEPVYEFPEWLPPVLLEGKALKKFIQKEAAAQPQMHQMKEDYEAIEAKLVELRTLLNYLPITFKHRFALNFEIEMKLSKESGDDGQLTWNFSIPGLVALGDDLPKLVLLADQCAKAEEIFEQGPDQFEEARKEYEAALDALFSKLPPSIDFKVSRDRAPELSTVDYFPRNATVSHITSALEARIDRLGQRKGQADIKALDAPMRELKESLDRARKIAQLHRRVLFILNWTSSISEFPAGPKVSRKQLLDFLFKGAGESRARSQVLSKFSAMDLQKGGSPVRELSNIQTYSTSYTYNPSEIAVAETAADIEQAQYEEAELNSSRGFFRSRLMIPVAIAVAVGAIVFVKMKSEPEQPTEPPAPTTPVEPFSLKNIDGEEYQELQMIVDKELRAFSADTGEVLNSVEAVLDGEGSEEFYRPLLNRIQLNPRIQELGLIIESAICLPPEDTYSWECEVSMRDSLDHTSTVKSRTSTLDDPKILAQAEGVPEALRPKVDKIMADGLGEAVKVLKKKNYPLPDFDDESELFQSLFKALQEAVGPELEKHGLSLLPNDYWLTGPSLQENLQRVGLLIYFRDDKKFTYKRKYAFTVRTHTFDWIDHPVIIHNTPEPFGETKNEDALSESTEFTQNEFAERYVDMFDSLFKLYVQQGMPEGGPPPEIVLMDRVVAAYYLEWGNNVMEELNPMLRDFGWAIAQPPKFDVIYEGEEKSKGRLTVDFTVADLSTGHRFTNSHEFDVLDGKIKYESKSFPEIYGPGMLGVIRNQTWEYLSDELDLFNQMPPSPEESPAYYDAIRRHILERADPSGILSSSGISIDPNIEFELVTSERMNLLAFTVTMRDSEGGKYSELFQYEVDGAHNIPKRAESVLGREQMDVIFEVVLYQLAHYQRRGATDYPDQKALMDHLLREGEVMERNPEIAIDFFTPILEEPLPDGGVRLSYNVSFKDTLGNDYLKSYELDLTAEDIENFTSK